MFFSHEVSAMAGSWSPGLHAVFLPGGPELAAYTVLPAEIRAVPIRILDMDQFPRGPWREREDTLSSEVVARLQATLTAGYPNLLPADPFGMRDGIGVRLGVVRLGSEPSDSRVFRFHMWTREASLEPIVQVAWDLLDPWRLGLLAEAGQIEPGTTADDGGMYAIRSS